MVSIAVLLACQLLLNLVSNIEISKVHRRKKKQWIAKDVRAGKIGGGVDGGVTVTPD